MNSIYINDSKPVTRGSNWFFAGLKRWVSKLNSNTKVFERYSAKERLLSPNLGFQEPAKAIKICKTVLQTYDHLDNMEWIAFMNRYDAILAEQLHTSALQTAVIAFYRVAPCTKRTGEVAAPLQPEHFRDENVPLFEPLVVRQVLSLVRS